MNKKIVCFYSSRIARVILIFSAVFVESSSPTHPPWPAPLREAFQGWESIWIRPRSALIAELSACTRKSRPRESRAGRQSVFRIFARDRHPRAVSCQLSSVIRLRGRRDRVGRRFSRKYIFSPDDPVGVVARVIVSNPRRLRPWRYDEEDSQVERERESITEEPSRPGN